jgi:DNA-binding SARP family transcriptional activator
MANMINTNSELVHPRELEEQADYRAYFFGPFRVFRRGQQLVDESTRRRKALMILKWFLLNPGKTCSADEFIELFWPDSPPRTALGNFHVTMHSLRRMLEPDLHPRQESAFIRRGPNNFYRFEVGESWWTDTNDLELLFGRAQGCDAANAAARACFYYRRVAGYCALGFLPEDDAEELLAPYRRRYHQVHTQALMRMMELHMTGTELEELLECAYQMLQVDPYNELATRVIADSLLQSGKPARAYRRVQQFCDSLERDLGVHPTKELCELRDRIQAALAGQNGGPSSLSSAVSRL